jgi:DNA repair photolyase
MPSIQLSLPVVPDSHLRPSPGRRLPRVERVVRKGPVLHPSPTADQDDVLSLNLTRGCVQRCAFCSVRGHATYAGDDVVGLYEDTAVRLDSELSARRRLPRAVYVCPSTDPFPPHVEIQDEAARVVEVLAAHGVETWLMTRGFIRPAALRTLAANREKVRVTVGLTTLDRSLQRVLEPLAASPSLRLRQIARLRGLGIPVQVSLEPLVPGLTDTRINLTGLLQALAVAGVRHVSAGYLFLRDGIRDNLLRALEPLGCGEMVVAAFEGGPVLSSGQIQPARYLPKSRRQRSYAALMALAAEHGLTVSVNGATNPDFRSPRATPGDNQPRQRLLPLFASLAPTPVVLARA